MRLLVTPSFVRATKKLHPPQKLELDAALRAISADPVAGEAKVGDLAGIRVYKFRLSNQMYLVGLSDFGCGKPETSHPWLSREFLP